MDPAVQGAIVGGSAAVAASAIAVVAQAFQARQNRRHEQWMRRQPDLRSACADFANEMRRVHEWQLKYEDEHGTTFTDQPYGPHGDTPAREEPAAERMLQELRMVDDDAVYAAARAYLNEYLRVWWGPPSGEARRPTDLEGARDRFVLAAREALYGD
jgi:hypothetical protein